MSKKKLKNQLNALSGKAKLEFFLSNNKTHIKDLMTTPPFLVQRALYPDTNTPKMAHVYLMSSSGGILQGDRLDIEIKAGPNTISHVTTQAATKIYSMENKKAIQKITLNLYENSYLEFAPFQIIPYKSSRYFQNVKIRMDRGANLFYSEVLTAGRIASGERFDMDICSLKLQCYDFSHKLLFTDLLHIEPKANKSLIESVFGNKSILLTIYLVGEKLSSSKVHDLVQQTIDDKQIAGCSNLPHDCGIVLRMLSDDYNYIFSKISDLSNKVKSFVS